MAKQLTERQQQIKDLLEQGQNANQIGSKLGISANAVYQQIRRMRQGGKGGASTARKSTAAKAGRQSAPKPPALPRAAAAPEPRPLTPLQALRTRRSEIEGEVKASASDLLAANKAKTAAEEAHAKLEARHADELKRLEKAESALTGAQTASKPRSRPKSTGKSKSSGKASSGSNGSSVSTPAEKGTPAAA